VKEYVVKNENSYYIVGTRISLDSIVYEFISGASPEGIQRSFPALALEEVYGAVAFYLANREEIDLYLSKGEKEFADLQDRSRVEYPAWYERMRKAREESLVS
jgi:uncharacterized protein (DUF433 family)